jgi:hypothetical protein
MAIYTDFSTPRTAPGSREAAAAQQARDISTYNSLASNPNVSFSGRAATPSTGGGTAVQLPVSTTVAATDFGTTPYNIPTSAPAGTNMAGAANVNNAIQGADGATGMYAPIETKTTDGAEAEGTALDKAIKALKPPEDSADAYNKAQEETQLLQKQQRQNNIQSALNAETTRMNLDLQNLRGVGAKEGVTEAVYGQQSAQVTREAMTRILPLQAQLAMAQDDVEMAQQRTDTLFKIYKEDADNRVDFYNNQVKMVYDDATAKEKRQYDENISQKNYERDLIKIQINAQNDAANTMLSDGNMAGYSAIMGIKPPQNFSDLNRYNSEVGQAVQKYGAISQEAISNPNLQAYASQYAETGKLPSPAELRFSGLSVADVTSMAKQTPKPSGALVSINTGVKPASLSAAQEDGIIALSEIVSQTLPAMKDRFDKIFTGVLGGIGGKIWTSQDRQDYLTFRQEFLNKLLKARSGAAVTENEYARYSDMLPSTFNQPFGLGSDGLKKLNSIETSMKANLDNTLNSNQLSIYGYSDVNVNGTKMKVGEVIDIGGTNYRVLPDGTLTDII